LSLRKKVKSGAFFTAFGQINRPKGLNSYEEFTVLVTITIPDHPSQRIYQRILFRKNGYLLEKNTVPQGITFMNLVMLDVDGTLTQSYEYDREIFGLSIAEVLGCNPADVDLDKYVNTTSIGVTVEAFQRIIGRSPKSEEIKDVKRRVLWRLKRMYQGSPEIFGEVPGASQFLERLRQSDGVGVAIATGGWLSEALFKLQASGLTVNGIPMATSDDHVDRKMIMEIATEKARKYYSCHDFEHIIYLGDGPWDLQASRSLGYDFIGIGLRIQALRDSENISWHPSFLKVEAVCASIATLLTP
jgi:phosphoglycolate phosphatase-like HAD superfamily hydrolase